MATQGILQMRLYALYSLDKRILGVVMACFVVALSISGYILSSTLSKLTRGVLRYRILLSYSLNHRIALAVNSPFGGMLCFADHLIPTFYLFWVPLMAFECILLGLAVFKGLQTLRFSGSLGRKLVTILVRDSVVYFFGWVSKFILSCSTSNHSTESASHMPGVWFLVLSHRYVSATDSTTLPNSLSADNAYRRSHRLYHFDDMCSQ